ncbi:MAG: type VI secretion system baseplate subunit TssF [Janthinobacterium lividum]
MREDLLNLYERELAYVRQMGAEFAGKYPRVASRLLLEEDRCEDPHVERLIESFAFLAARVHLRLEDDLSEITSALLQLVYPHYLRPLPAMSIAEFQVDPAQGKQSAAFVVPRGTALVTKRKVEGMPCRFRTCYPVQLWPMTVAECGWRAPEAISSPLRVPGAVAVLRILLRAGEDISLADAGLDKLVFYLAGNSAVTLNLYELLSSKCMRIVLRHPSRPDKPVELDSGMLQPCGFDEEESLLPYSRQSFDGYRLIQEYFSFPEKFLFFRLSGLEAIRALAATDQFEVLLYIARFDRPERAQALEVGVSASTLRLGCTPIVNLFAHTAEPMLLSHTNYEYRVVPDMRHQHMMEVFSVDSVLATSPSRRMTTPIDPLYAFRFQSTSATRGVFWHNIRRYSPLGEDRPSDMYLSLVDIDGELSEPDAEVLTAKCTCTNHDLPSRLTFNASDGDFDAEGYGVVQHIRAIHRPTASCEPPRGKGQLWRLISQLSLNHLSLSEGGLSALQEILRLHNFTTSPQLETQIGSITGLTSQRHFALVKGEHGSSPARGTRVELQVDERQFSGGGAYLFGAVLDRFLGLYSSMNSFCQLSITTNLRKEALGEWPARAGNRPLI